MFYIYKFQSVCPHLKPVWDLTPPITEQSFWDSGSVFYYIYHHHPQTSKPDICERKYLLKNPQQKYTVKTHSRWQLNISIAKKLQKYDNPVFFKKSSITRYCYPFYFLVVLWPACNNMKSSKLVVLDKKHQVGNTFLISNFNNSPEECTKRKEAACKKRWSSL